MHRLRGQSVLFQTVGAMGGVQLGGCQGLGRHARGEGPWVNHQSAPTRAVERVNNFWFKPSGPLRKGR
jgi:hypothetical protein